MLPDWLNSLLEPYAAMTREGSPFPVTAAARLPDVSFDRLCQLAFVLLRPEMLRSRTAAALLDCLASEHSAIPVAMRVARLGRDAVQALYQLRLAQWGERIWLHEDLFAAGPCALMLMRCPTGTPGSLSARLDAAKGPTAFLTDAHATLRARFGRASSIHAIMHVSSDEGALLYEGSLFFPWPVISGALNGGNSLPLDTCGALLDCEPHAAASVFEALAAVKVRIYAALELCGSALTPGAASGLRRDAETLQRLLAGLPPACQQPIFTAAALHERPILADLICAARVSAVSDFPAAMSSSQRSVLDAWSATEALLEPVELLYSTWLLTGNEWVDSTQLDTLLRRLERSNVPISDWLRTLLAAGYMIDLRSH